MQSIQSFFLFCAGAHPGILKRTPTDVHKFVGIGATIFFTGVFACIAASFALHTVFDSYIISLLFGIIWGLMIFNLDRYIVMSIKKKGSSFQQLLTVSPRLLLAVLIAFVISKPLELKLFQSEIQSELVIMEQEVFKEQEDKLRTRFQPGIDSLQNSINKLEAQITNAKIQRDELNMIAIKEADGTGGSMQKNLGPIYLAKKKDADLAQEELDVLLAANNPIIQDTRFKIQESQSNMEASLLALKQSSLNGFAAQLDALGRLSIKSRTIWLASLFITLLFIAIETAPIFTKLISYRSPYDFKLDAHEYLFESRYIQETSRLKNALEYDMVFDKEITKYKTQLATAAEKEILQDLIQDELKRVRKTPLSWKMYLQNRNIFGSA